MSLKLADLIELERTFADDLSYLYDKILYNKENGIFIIRLMENEEELKKEWQELESFVNAYLQNDEKFIAETFSNQDIIWDIYIVILVDFEIANKLKMEIESDRFFCKKIILDYKSELNYTEHLAELSLFQDFFATGDVDSSINEDNFKINLTKNLNNEKIEKLILNPGFIDLEEKEMRAAVSDWVTEVDNDV
jgi:hypothetical protein